MRTKVIERLERMNILRGQNTEIVKNFYYFYPKFLKNKSKNRFISLEHRMLTTLKALIS